MTRRPVISVLVAAALAAWVHVSGRTRSWRAPRSVEMNGSRDAPTAEPIRDHSSGVVATRRLRTRRSRTVAQSAPADEVPIVERGARDRRNGDWDVMLDQLDDVLARCQVWSLDFLLDLDVGVTDEVRTAIASGTREASDLGPTADVPGSAPDVAAPETARFSAGYPGHLTGGTTTPNRPPEPQVAPAEDSPRPHRDPASSPPPEPGALHDGAPTSRRLDAAGAVVGRDDIQSDAARCDDGDPCTLDRCRGTGCVHEQIPGGERFCAWRSLVMARQRLLDEAPATAFRDASSRSRVRVRLGRALRLVDREITRVDDAAGRRSVVPTRNVARHIAGYEKRVHSRTVERGLVNPTLTRALHFPPGGLAPLP